MKDKIISVFIMVFFMAMCFLILKLHSMQKDDFRPLKTERPL